MVTTHYVHAPQQNVHYGYMPPPSPPMDETSKCSLPSISNLLGLADQGSPTSETSPQSQQQCMRCLPCRDVWRSDADGLTTAQTIKPETRPSSSHYGNPALLRTALPPSPPMSSDASLEEFNSSPTRTVSQASSGSYYFETTPPLQMEVDRRQMAATAAVPRVTVQASTYQPQFTAPAYVSQPAMASYYPPMQAAAPPQPQMSGLYYQRALPQVRSSRGPPRWRKAGF